MASAGSTSLSILRPLFALAFYLFSSQEDLCIFRAGCRSSANVGVSISWMKIVYEPYSTKPYKVIRSVQASVPSDGRAKMANKAFSTITKTYFRTLSVKSFPWFVFTFLGQTYNTHWSFYVFTSIILHNSEVSTFFNKIRNSFVNVIALHSNLNSPVLLKGNFIHQKYSYLAHPNVSSCQFHQQKQNNTAFSIAV